MEFVSFEEARSRPGLRMVVVPGVPSPWGEAAKGILYVKKIPYVAVRLDAGNRELVEWAGEASGPVAVLDDEAPRGGWSQILLLAERLAPERPLIPTDAAQRAELFGLSHEICGEMGLGWCRRLVGVADSLAGGAGFPKPVAEYLAPKYGYREGIGDEARRRVLDLLGLLAGRLRAQREHGSDFYLGDALTALDVYSAAFMALFRPLPEEHCPMPEPLRQAFETLDADTAAALDPILLEHRDRVYAEHLELPLTL